MKQLSIQFWTDYFKLIHANMLTEEEAWWRVRNAALADWESGAWIIPESDDRRVLEYMNP